MSGVSIVVLEIIAPFVFLIVHGRIKIAKAKSKAAADDPTPAPGFEPKPEPAPGWFLRHFSMPQRAYLRQQITLGKAFYYLMTYVYVAMFTSGLLPSFVNGYGLEQPLAQRVWYSYLEHVSLGGWASGILMLIAATVVLGGLATGAQAIFSRTRPLTHRFLFWARILSAIATIVASLVTAAAASFALLLVFYGPAWQHLQDSIRPGMILSNEQSTHLIQLLQVSAPRLFLSCVTTALLVFSGALFVIGPSSRFMGKWFLQPLVIVASVLAAPLIRAHSALSDSLFSRALFLYPGLGPPPAYACLFVPILASVAFLFIAQFFIRRAEL